MTQQQTCPRCGKRLPQHALFCRRCGMLQSALGACFDWAAAGPVPTPRLPPARPRPRVAPSGRSSGRGWWGVLFVGFFVIRGCLISRRFEPPHVHDTSVEDTDRFLRDINRQFPSPPLETPDDRTFSGHPDAGRRRPTYPFPLTPPSTPDIRNNAPELPALPAMPAMPAPPWLPARAERASPTTAPAPPAFRW